MAREVLFLFLGKSALEQQLEVAAYFKERGLSSVFLFLSPADARLSGYVESRGFVALLPPGVIAGPPAEPVPAATTSHEASGAGHAEASWRERLKKIEVLRFPLATFKMWRRLQREKMQFRTLLAERDWQCVVTAQERSVEFLPALWAAGELGVPRLILPTSALLMPDGGVDMRWFRGTHELMAGINPAYHQRFPERKSAFLGLMNRLVAWASPGQVNDDRHGPMLYSPASEIVALYLAGLLPANLWQQGTRFAEGIVVSGDDETDVCLKSGIAAEKVHRIGSTVFDQVRGDHVHRREEIANGLRRKYTLAQKPILTFSFAPMFEHFLMTREAHFGMYRDALRLAGMREFTVLVSLHPMMKKAEYAWVEQEGLGRLLDEDLKDVLGAADAFVSVGYSSTNRWCAAAGIPFVNLDILRSLNSTYSAFYDYPSVFRLAELEENLFRISRHEKVIGESRGGAENRPLNTLADGAFFPRLYELVTNFRKGDTNEHLR